jgi:ribosome-associated toxin RatA of RatAB toxin-antitoxin module
MGLNWAEHTEEIDAPVEICFDAIVDYESFPRWQDAVDSVEVISRTPDGLGEDVRLFVDAKIRKIDYVLRYSYTRPTEIRWDFVEGNGMRDVDGVYTLESLGPERTRATYNLGADPELPVPGMILRRTHRQLVKRSVEDLRHEAERRHQADEEAQTATPPVADTETEVEEVPIGDEGEVPRTEASPGDDWVPKAEREAQTRTAEGSGPSAGAPRPSRPSVGDLAGELAEHAIQTGRAVAGGAARAGMGVAEQAVHAGREAVDELIQRLNRKPDDDSEERRD